MKAPQGTLDDAIVSVFEKEARAAAHPPIETLVAYVAGDMDEGESEAIRDHLARCDVCADMVLDWQDFPTGEPDDPALRSRPDDEAEDWRAILGRLEQPPAKVVPIEHGRAPRLRFVGWPGAVAAAALAAIAGIAFWLGTLAQGDGDARANFQIAELMPVGSGSLRGGGVEERVRQHVDTDHLVLALGGLVLDPAGAYRATLEGADGSVVMSWAQLKPTPEGSLTVEFPRAVGDGSYRLRVDPSGADIGTAPLARYALRIERAPPG